MAKRFGVMLDMSRNAVMKPEQVKELAVVLKKMGYNMIQLYMEDTYEIPEEPYFGYLRGKYTQDELREIVSFCDSLGVEVIPCMQTLAHLNQMFKWKTYSSVNDTAAILLVDEEKTYELIENMFRSLRECFTTDRIHIGMDEAHMLGRGKYQDKHGYENRFDILRRHLERVIALAEKYGFKPMMWSDMFYRLVNNGKYYSYDPNIITDEVLAACPDGVDQVYWDYYSDDKARYDAMLDSHARFGGEKWFAGGAWAWIGFCPNNNWTMRSMKPAMESCVERGVDNILMTAWGNYGKLCSFYALLPSLYAVRRFYDGVEDMEQIKTEFEELLGERFDDMMLLDIPLDMGPMDRVDYASAVHTSLLYNDPLMGIIDPCVHRSFKEEYREMEANLKEAAKSSQYGYLFESQAALCRALAYKHDLGVRTREAYQAKDKDALRALIEDYMKAIDGIEKFAVSFRKLWYKENKPHGFDVPEIRFGALLFRLRSARDRILGYVNGEVESIAELEETLLPYNGRGADNKAPLNMPHINFWDAAVTPNIL